MSRKGRFSKHFHQTQSSFKEYEELWATFQEKLNTSIHPAELIGNYLKLITVHRRKKNWRGSLFRWFSPLKTTTLASNEFLEFWCNNTLRGIPHKVNQVLINWYLGYYPCVLIHHVPTAEEMLIIQAQGKRYVTVFLTLKEWKEEIHHGRDHFSFTVHDLIHASEFFQSEMLKNAQIVFYKKLLNHYPYLKELSTSAEYQHSLHYLISDMNTHPEHMEVYFQGLLKRSNLTPYNLNL